MTRTPEQKLDAALQAYAKGRDRLEVAEVLSRYLVGIAREREKPGLYVRFKDGWSAEVFGPGCPVDHGDLQRVWVRADSCSGDSAQQEGIALVLTELAAALRLGKLKDLTTWLSPFSDHLSNVAKILDLGGGP